MNDRAVEAVLAVLPATAEPKVPASANGSVVSIGRQRLKPSWIGEGELRDARRYLASERGDLDVAVARQLSAGAIEALRDAGVGFVDETGVAEVAAGSVLVSRTGVRPKPEPHPRRWVGSVFSVTEALLCGVSATVHACAAATGLSVGSATNGLAALVEFGLLEVDEARGPRSGRRLDDPAGLLDAYQNAVATARAKPSITVGVPAEDLVGEVAGIGKLFDDAELDWAATGQVAAAVMAPHLSQVTTAEVYVDATNGFGLHRAAGTAGLRPIEGGRLTLRCFPTAATKAMATEAQDLRVAPWPRVFLDLAGTGVRGEEAAEHLREVCSERWLSSRD